MAMQEIEGNPFDEADKALFEMFERENLSPDERRRIIIMQAKGQSVPADPGTIGAGWESHRPSLSS
jgi:hypothetical protein